MIFIKSIKNTIKSIYKLIPLRNVILMESLNDLDCNTGALFEYLIENKVNEKYKIYWLVNDKKRYNNIKIKNVKFLTMYKYNLIHYFHIFTARYLIWDNKAIHKVRKEQKSIYLTHGAPPLKSVKEVIDLPQNIDFVLCPSEEVIDIMTEQFNISKDKLNIVGHPRNDFLYKKWGMMQKIYGDNIYLKKIIWMPTFRKLKNTDRVDSNKEFKLGIPLFDEIKQIKELNKILKDNNILLIIKIHPGADLSMITANSYSNINILSDEQMKSLGINLYKLLPETDALITDYSTVAFDYLLLNKPIGYIIDDIDEYKLGFSIENPLELMPGHKIKEIKDLYLFIEDLKSGQDKYKDFRKKVCKLTNKYSDSNNRKRICENIGL